MEMSDAYPALVLWHVEIKTGDEPWKAYSKPTPSRTEALNLRDSLKLERPGEKFRGIRSCTTYIAYGEV